MMRNNDYTPLLDRKEKRSAESKSTWKKIAGGALLLGGLIGLTLSSDNPLSASVNAYLWNNGNNSHMPKEDIKPLRMETNYHTFGSDGETTYRGAVLEMQVTYHNSYPQGAEGEYDPVESVEEAQSYQEINIDAMTPYIEEASAQSVDILVLGEFTLNGLIYTRDEMLDYIEQVPDPDACSTSQECTPCDNTDFDDSPTLQDLSCLAIDNDLYLVINSGDYITCETGTGDAVLCTDGRYQYNTQIVFDNKGTIIAKYWKIHTYEEKEYNVPDWSEGETYGTFTMTAPHSVDSNGDAVVVEFGIAICYDSMYQSPYIPLMQEKGITDFVMSHWWVNTGPTLNIAGWLHALSSTYGINVLYSAGTWWNSGYMPSDSSGSGILSQDTVIAAYYNQFSTKEDGYLVIGDVPTDITSNADSLPTFEGYLESEDYESVASNYCNTSVIIQAITIKDEGKTFSESLTCGDFTCSVSATIDSAAFDYNNNPYGIGPNYLWMYVYTGYYYIPDGGDIYYHENFCHVGICDGKCYNYGRNGRTSHTSFTQLTVEGNYDSDDTIFAVNMDYTGSSPSGTNFDITQSEDGSVRVESNDGIIGTDMLGLSVIGRTFNLDTRYVGEDVEAEEKAKYATIHNPSAKDAINYPWKEEV